jgi:DNA gyrase/topoisomerase IV, subunit A
MMPSNVLSLSLFISSPSRIAGWSTSVPTYNPREIIANLRLMIAGEEPQEMHPWYRGFKGDYPVLTASLSRSFFYQDLQALFVTVLCSFDLNFAWSYSAKIIEQK